MLALTRVVGVMIAVVGSPVIGTVIYYYHATVYIDEWRLVRESCDVVVAFYQRFACQ